MLTGIIFAAAAGVLLGNFQITHKKASESIPDRYIRLIVLLSVSVAIIFIILIFSKEISDLKQINISAVCHFIISGLIHFYFGFNLMSLSQDRTGASKTSVLIGTSSIFSALAGFLVFRETLGVLILAGMTMVFLGIIFVSRGEKKDNASGRKSDYIYGLLTALCYGVSPMFVRFGLRTYNHPLSGAWIGMAAALITFLFEYLFKHRSLKEIHKSLIPGKGLWIEITAGLFISSATWLRYLAVSMVQLATVTTLTRINLPVVLILSPLVIGKKSEKISLLNWIGAAVIIAGSVLIGLSGK